MILNQKKKKSLILLFKIYKQANLKAFWATKLRISNRRNYLNSSIDNSIKHVYQRYNGRLSKMKKEKKEEDTIGKSFFMFCFFYYYYYFFGFEINTLFVSM